MEIQLTNTLTKQKELFRPIEPGKMKMYHCGPTVYWNQQIGNMRAMVMADIIRRIFIYNNYDVTFVRNYTDVGHLTGDNIGDADQGEDRMEKAAKRENLSPDIIADKYIKAFNEDIASLHVLPPTHATRATHYISDMIEMTKTLLEKGFAYTTEHAVYFEVKKFADYTKLSGQKLEHQETGEGHGTVSDPQKKDPHDFALWVFKAGTHANALQTWESPFNSPLVENGRGFPGWHIECSAMIKHHLGKTIDLHMGGVEHIPIHHTNEIAQSECANGEHFVNYWVHNEHLLVDGKKMGKSEGNSYVMKDIVDHGFEPLILRYFFLQAHYRSKQNFTWEGAEASRTAFTKLKQTFLALPQGGAISETYENRFHEAINDDFNGSQGLAITWELLKDDNVSPADKKATLLKFDEVLGFDLKNLTQEVIEIPTEVEELLVARQEARNQKDWNKADQIRMEIESYGLMVKDTSEGQKIEKK
jgi:cysteinyl-tRNA synthetase